MITNSHLGSAKIIKFPARGRFAVGDDREACEAVSPAPASNIASVHVAKVTAGSGWYHEAAVQDAERARHH